MVKCRRMQAEDFLRKWSAGSPAHALGERTGALAHSIGLRRVLGVPEPGDPDSGCFERGLTQTGGAGTPGERHVLRLGEVARPEVQQRLRALWLAPESHKPRLSNREITVQAARTFAGSVERMRAAGVVPAQASHLLTQ